ncbi:hypothetical protein [Caulobacter radicis]|uniref:hypothetical protein n=1 Tax=Caulobacter radicis TaxID=2172650 RepID=UPI003134483C
MYAELTDTIFADDVKEIVFSSACITMYRYSLLVSNRVIPQNMKRFKWHMLALVKAIITGKDNPPLNSRSAEKAATAIANMMGQHSIEATDIFLKATKICQELGEVSSDRLKRQAILTEMMSRV